ncbi:unnamed protein product [Darwinula stevensoni]|uniref:Elongation of very long chain fatty acids protein n=1 Tax=Darwinula stevensoni TaxID=69355 RepID=A0A7R9FP12_9CRUS|nr:unnamed protein product [Darwinula stevensoni]CAG0897026.1 unnamed protein product [Darwinula stevensoni]
MDPQAFLTENRGEFPKDYDYDIQATKAFYDENRETSYWHFLFALSKVPELGDTVFLLLKKQPLRFLHWYHHITVLIFCWQSQSEHASTGLWFCSMNLVVHSTMYSYFAARTLGINVGRGVAMFITVLQILQMVMGLALSLSAAFFKLLGISCHVTPYNALLSVLMYFSYLALFVAFFRDSYLRKPKVNTKKDS